MANPYIRPELLISSTQTRNKSMLHELCDLVSTHNTKIVCFDEAIVNKYHSHKHNVALAATLYYKKSNPGKKVALIDLCQNDCFQYRKYFRNRTNSEIYFNSASFRVRRNKANGMYWFDCKPSLQVSELKAFLSMAIEIFDTLVFVNENFEHTTLSIVPPEISYKTLYVCNCALKDIEYLRSNITHRPKDEIVMCGTYYESTCQLLVDKAKTIAPVCEAYLPINVMDDCGSDAMPSFHILRQPPSSDDLNNPWLARLATAIFEE